MVSSKEKSHKYNIEKIFIDMRNMAFNANPTTDLNIKQKKKNQIYGVFMETGYDDYIISLRCFAEGTISIYLSIGGGIIGIGEHEIARKTGLDFIKEADNYLAKSKLTTDYGLPNPGKTIFYILTFDGIYTYMETEDDLGNRKSDFSPLFFKAQDVITQARIIDESRSEDAPL